MAETKSDNIFKDKIKELYESEINTILNLINQEYKQKTNNNDLFHIINIKDILEKWKTNININLNNFDFLKNDDNKKKRPIDPINYCYARKPNLKRCTRNKKNNSDYCASHQFNLLYGRIDQEIDENIKNINNINNINNIKRNFRKKKDKVKESKPPKESKPKLPKESKIKTPPKKKKTNKQIVLNKINIDNNAYLIDKQNFVYISEMIDDKIKYRNIGIFNHSTNKIENIIDKKTIQQSIQQLI